MNLRLVVGVVVAILLIALVTLIAFQLERVEREIDVGLEGEARTNPLLAAQRLLTRMGLPAESARHLDVLPPSDGMLILAVEDRILTETRTRKLLDWVAAGGFLVVSPHMRQGQPTAETDRDPLLEELGISVERYEPDPGPGSREESLLQITDEPALNVRFSGRHALAVDRKGEDDELYNFVWDDYGDGIVVVLNDMGFMSNDEIGELDHAAFLWQLAEFVGQRTEVLLVFGQQRGSILKLLLRHAWPAVLGGALVLIAVIWRRASRFGPVLAPPPRARRSLIEHVEAAGNFLWQHKRQQVLIDATREALLSKAVARRPDVARLKGRRRAEALALGTDIPAKRIASALSGDCPQRRDALTRSIRTLEALRRSL